MSEIAQENAGVMDPIDKNVAAIYQIERKARGSRSLSTKIADAIAAFCGSILFVWVHVAWFGIWLLINATHLAPERFRFDKPPFPMLTLVVSLEAIFLSTFILISQNRQQAVADHRNNIDLQINLLAEQENSEMMRMMQRLFEHLKIPLEDPAFDQLCADTDPEVLAAKIEGTTEPFGDQGKT